MVETREVLLNRPLTKLERQLDAVRQGEVLAEVVIKNHIGGSEYRVERYRQALVIDKTYKERTRLELRTPTMKRGESLTVSDKELTNIRPGFFTRLFRVMGISPFELH